MRGGESLGIGAGGFARLIILMWLLWMCSVCGLTGAFVEGIHSVVLCSGFYARMNAGDLLKESLTA